LPAISGDSADISIAVLKATGHKIELLEYHAPTDRNRPDLQPCDLGAVHVAFTVDVSTLFWKRLQRLAVPPRASLRPFEPDRIPANVSSMFAIPTARRSS